MPLIKNPHKSGVDDWTPLIEDPRTTSNTIYFYGDAYEKSTFNPIYDKGLSERGTNVVEDWGFPYAGVTDDIEDLAGHPGHTIATAKQCIGITQTTNTGDTNDVNVDLTPTISMDENNPSRVMKLFQNGNDKMIVHCGWNYRQTYRQSYYNNIGETELYDTSVGNFIQQTYVNSTPRFMDFIPLYLDSNGYISGISNESEADSSAEQWMPYFSMFRIDGFPSYGGSTRLDNYRRNYNIQFMGPSEVDGLPIFLHTAESNDYTHYIRRYNTPNNTETTLHSFTALPSGGARTYTNLGRQTKVASKTFVDHSGNTAFYVPYFDSSSTYQPLYYSWNKSDDTVTQSESTMSGATSNTVLLSTAGNNGDGDKNGWQSCMYNDTFVYNSTRYVTLFPLQGGYQRNDAVTTARTFVTYSVDPADNSSLTYHSSVVVPSTIKNVLFLDDARNRLAVVEQNAIRFYKFTTNGWTYTGNYTGKCHGLGVGLDGTLYATMDDHGSGYLSIHTINTDIPLLVEITPENETYSYTGTNINSYINVDAWDYANNRVETTLTLEIDGSTMTFANGDTTGTVTTSSSGTSNVAITITGAGFSNFITKVQV